MNPRTLFVGAPSGGHLYPALSVMRELREGWQIDSMLLTHEGETERQILGTVTAPSADVSPSTLMAFPRSLRQQWRTLAELWQSAPWDGCVAFGGRSCVVPALFTAYQRRPLFLHEQNRVLGKTHRWLSRIARRVFLSYSDTRMPRRLAHRALFLGCPVRREFEGSPSTRGVEGGAATEPTIQVTVLGGSQGSQDLNQLAAEGLCRWGGSEARRAESLRVLHVCGAGKQGTLRERYRQSGIEARVVEYLPSPAEEFRESALILCRGGGTTVAELCAVGRAALLLPYPHHADRQQFLNAEAMQDVAAGRVIAEDPGHLARLLGELLEHPQTLRQMGERARQLTVPRSARRVAEVIATHLDCGARPWGLELRGQRGGQQTPEQVMKGDAA